jgi:3-oxoacyl-[acyl-carrier-protein] synthase-3
MALLFQGPIGIRSIGVYYPENIETSSDIANQSGIPEEVIREKFGIESKHKAAIGETVSDMCVKAALDCIEGVIKPEEIDLIIYHGSEYRDYYLYNCSAHIQHKLGAVNAKTFEVHNLCSSGALSLQLAKSLMITQPELKNVLLVVGTRESDLVDYKNTRARFMFNFGDGAAACLVQKGYEKNQILETEMITDGRFATDVAVYGVGNVNYQKNKIVDKCLQNAEAAEEGSIGYYGLDVADPENMKVNLDPISLPNFNKVIAGAVEKSGYGKHDIKFLAPIFMKKSILNLILSEFGMTEDQSFILKNFGHVQSADAYIAIHEALKLGTIKDGDLVVMLGAGTGYSWAATAVRWG